MSNKLQLHSNNMSLDSLIARIDTAKNTAASLPSGGSGGGAIETCTVSITHDNISRSMIVGVFATSYKDGILSSMYGENRKYNGGGYVGDIDISPTNFIIENVICGSKIILITDMYSACVGYGLENATRENEHFPLDIDLFVAVITINAPSGGIATISVYDDD